METTLILRKATCPKCGYTWVTRKERPVECPDCKKRLRWNLKK